MLDANRGVSYGPARARHVLSGAGVFARYRRSRRHLAKLGFGEGGIRTHGTRKGSAVFKTAAFNHSATSPNACKSLRQLTFSLNTVSHKVTSRLTVSHIAATILAKWRLDPSEVRIYVGCAKVSVALRGISRVDPRASAG